MKASDSRTTTLLYGSQPIALHASPYSYVRTIVMKSQLFEKHDYDKMLKMQLSEIIQFLEESVYKREIDELAVSEAGVQLVEHAVNRNFRRSVEKLRRITDDELRLLIDAYLWRNDVQNIKTMLRAKHSHIAKERFANLIVPATIAKETLLYLYSKEKVEDMLVELSVPFAKNFLRVYQDHGLTELEGELTKQYYQQTLAVAQRIKGEGETFRDFLLQEISIINIMMILKLKHEGASKEHIESHLIKEEHSTLDHVSDMKTQARMRLVHKLINAKTVGDAFTILEKTREGSTLEEAAEQYEKTRSLLATERELQRYLLRRATLLTHQHPLSVDVVLGYLFSKVQETKNIFMLIKGKQLGVTDAFLEKELIIA